ncbi:hypothetical protein J2Y49_006356 [Azospirillum sp. BE72]|nr:hypothetical protein [Azospirillum sp. BE72]
MRGAGFVDIVETHRWAPLFGTLALWRAAKQGTLPDPPVVMSEGNTR